MAVYEGYDTEKVSVDLDREIRVKAGSRYRQGRVRGWGRMGQDGGMWVRVYIYTQDMPLGPGCFFRQLDWWPVGAIHKADSRRWLDCPEGE